MSIYRYVEANFETFEIELQVLSSKIINVLIEEDFKLFLINYDRVIIHELAHLKLFYIYKKNKIDFKSIKQNFEMGNTYLQESFASSFEEKVDTNDSEDIEISDINNFERIFQILVNSLKNKKEENFIIKTFKELFFYLPYAHGRNKFHLFLELFKKYFSCFIEDLEMDIIINDFITFKNIVDNLMDNIEYIDVEKISLIETKLRVLFNKSLHFLFLNSKKIL